MQKDIVNYVHYPHHLLVIVYIHSYNLPVTDFGVYASPPLIMLIIPTSYIDIHGYKSGYY